MIKISIGLIILMLLNGCTTPLVAVGSTISSVVQYVQVQEVQERLNVLESY